MPERNQANPKKTPALKAADLSQVENYIHVHLKEDVNRSGLLSAHHVVKFVKSPTGKSVLIYIQQELEIIAAQEKQSEFLAQQEYLLKIRLLGILALMKEDRNNDTVKLNQDITSEQRNKLLKKLMRPNERKPSSETILTAYRQTLSDYVALRNILSTTLQTKKNKLVQIDGKIAAIQHILPAAKNAFNQAMTTTTVQGTINQIKLAAALPLPSRKNHIVNAHALAKRQAVTTAQKISPLNTPATMTHQERRQQEHDLIVAQLADIYSQQRLRDEHSRLEDARFYTEDYKPTDDYERAAYIIPVKQKIISHEGRYYLLKQDETIEQLGQRLLTRPEVTEKHYTAKTTGFSLQQAYYLALQQELAETQADKKMCINDIDAIQARKNMVESQITEIETKISSMEHVESTIHPEASAPANSTRLYPTPLLTQARPIQREHSSHRLILDELGSAGNDFAPTRKDSSPLAQFIKELQMRNTFESKFDLGHPQTASFSTQATPRLSPF